MNQYGGHIFLMGAFALAGTSVVAGRLVTTTLGTFTIAAASLFFALLGLLPVCGRTLAITFRRMSKGDWLRLMMQALFGIFLFRMFLLQGLLRTSAGEAGILTGTTPAVTVVLARLLLKEPIDKLRFCGLVSTVTGILLIQGLFSSTLRFSGEHFIGNVLVLCAAVCESFFNVISRMGTIKASLRQAAELNPIDQTTLVVLIALLLCLGPALYERPAAALQTLGITGWLALIWYGLFVTALAFILWYAGINRCDASLAAAFSGMMPFTALLLSILILQEEPGWQQWLGGFMIVSGMILTGLNPANSKQTCNHLQAN
ncbi:DMT family transporter [Sporomusa acidovorans]|uniref:EamA domain-containing protein n=1 Tax=Sporomusa acidovorans (strain ATCC 49682 / DSM 3132 / Mol) TaxID=1123286 RepID=A0ABZ3J9M1_SPOA4|nr:DMT family transporter [Sporomusa acidovorans]OZC21798.1 aromatic amino acid exporter [Sporomusa acidovorans DSM 3132]SDD56617.1 Uncharacterized membrane protein [Sporomusa acidovorans]